MEKLISVAVMRTSDAAEIAGGTDSKTLMYRAGLGLLQSWDWHGKIDIVTGSGNNAGDGYVLALLLHQHGIPCRISAIRYVPSCCLRANACLHYEDSNYIPQADHFRVHSHHHRADR